MFSKGLGSGWMEDKLKDMELIVNEKFEECAHPGLDDFLTENCESPTDRSSLISISSSSPSSFASSFNESISEPQMDNEGKNKCANTPELLLLNNCGDKKQIEEVDFSGQNSNVESIRTVVGVDTKLRPSKLPTPSEKLTNCSTLTRSPVQDTQLECIMKELRTTDTTKVIQCSLTNDKSQTSSGRSSSNDTYVISHSSCEERVSEALNESVTSEASSLSSSLSVESVTGNKKSRLPRTASSIATKPTARAKVMKPSAKPSLLPSKVLDKSSKTLLRQPLCKSNGTKKLVKPASTLGKSSKVRSLKQQENGGIPRVATLNAAPRPNKRLPQSKSRLRRSSIPKPIAVSDLRKKQLPMDSSAELETTCVLKSASDSVVQSTPIPVQSKTETETGATPSRKRSVISETPTRDEEFGESGSRVRPSFSLSSIEGSTPAKSTSPTPPTETMRGKTPKTVTKRRSLLPTPGGKELAIPPLSFGTPNKKPRDVSQQQVSGSPQLDDRQAMPPPKKSLKLRTMSSGLQKPKAVPTRNAFKPRNGTMFKRDGPIKSNPLLYGDNSEMVPKMGGSKVVHSPINKENVPSTPHSEWSPIRKSQDFNGDDAFYKCTKRTAK